jgi:hypothetical protein
MLGQEFPRILGQKWKTFSTFLWKGLMGNPININKIIFLWYRKGLASVLLILQGDMLTRSDVLKELRRIGVKEPGLLKAYLRDFENYMAFHYDLKIIKNKKKVVDIPKQNPPLSD